MAAQHGGWRWRQQQRAGSGAAGSISGAQMALFCTCLMALWPSPALCLLFWMTGHLPLQLALALLPSDGSGFGGRPRPAYLLPSPALFGTLPHHHARCAYE